MLQSLPMRALALPLLIALCAAPVACDGSIGTDGGASIDGATNGSDGGIGLGDAAMPTLAIDWELLTASIQGGLDNGFALDCDDPKIAATSLEFTVESSTGTSRTLADCPAGTHVGTVTLALPDAVGPYTLSATVAGKPMSASERVRDVRRNSAARVRIYGLGCDMPACR